MTGLKNRFLVAVINVFMLLDVTQFHKQHSGLKSHREGWLRKHGNATSEILPPEHLEEAAARGGIKNGRIELMSKGENRRFNCDQIYVSQASHDSNDTRLLIAHSIRKRFVEQAIRTHRMR
jgi:hypothetical protein